MLFQKHIHLQHRFQAYVHIMLKHSTRGADQSGVHRSCPPHGPQHRQRERTSTSPLVTWARVLQIWNTMLHIEIQFPMNMTSTKHRKNVTFFLKLGLHWSNSKPMFYPLRLQNAGIPHILYLTADFCHKILAIDTNLLFQMLHLWN